MYSMIVKIVLEAAISHNDVHLELEDDDYGVFPPLSFKVLMMETLRMTQVRITQLRNDPSER